MLAFSCAMVACFSALVRPCGATCVATSARAAASGQACPSTLRAAKTGGIATEGASQHCATCCGERSRGGFGHCLRGTPVASGCSGVRANGDDNVPLPTRTFEPCHGSAPRER
jgi:hypothetical protein